MEHLKINTLLNSYKKRKNPNKNRNSVSGSEFQKKLDNYMDKPENSSSQLAFDKGKLVLPKSDLSVLVELTSQNKYKAYYSE